MKQLSGLDASFLQMERGNTMLHGAALSIYDPSTAPGGHVRFKDILRFFTARIRQFPQFRRRLVTVPFSLDRPYWVEDPDIDVEFHVRHIALPHPGDWRQLCIQVARLHSRRLDFSKPPWEIYVIEGLDNVPGVPKGSFALYFKMHHCAADGELGTIMLQATHSLAPVSFDEDGAPEMHAVADREPTHLELYSRALIHGLENVPAMARVAATAATRLGVLGSSTLQEAHERYGNYLQMLRAFASGDLSVFLPKIPETRFGGEITVHRVFEAVGLPLADFKLVRRHVPEATVNDQFMALVGGALREYLDSKGELPEESMLAAMPLTLRGTDKSEEGNQITFTFVPVRTDIADPLERVRAIHADSAKAKQTLDVLGKSMTKDLLDVMPYGLTNVLSRYAKMPGVGLVVSNIRGPDVPLYMAGARLYSYAPISMVLDGTGLNITGFSYAGTMWICALSCREMLPDPAYLADCLRRSFASLKEAAQRLPLHEGGGHKLPARATVPGKPARRKPARAAKRPARKKRDATA